MMIYYDKDLVKKYRKLAITSVDQLQIGNVYYSNDYGLERFLVKRLLTHKEHYNEEGMEYTYEDGDEIGWFEVSRPKSKSKFYHRMYDVHSLHDHNIGASYNPWLIFDDKKIMEEYKQALKITRAWASTRVQV